MNDEQRAEAEARLAQLEAKIKAEDERIGQIQKRVLALITLTGGEVLEAFRTGAEFTVNGRRYRLTEEE